MAERLPRVTGPDTIRALQRGGWYAVRQTGSHVILHHDKHPGARVTVANHAGVILAPKTLKAILDQAGLTVEAFTKLL